MNKKQKIDRIKSYCTKKCEDLNMILNYNKLWKLMIDKGISKTQLIKMTGISTNSLSKLGKNESVQLAIILKICKVLECMIDDIVDYKFYNI